MSKNTMEQDYAEIRKRITNRYNNRAEFFSHLVAFLVVNGLIWLLLDPQGTWFTVAGVFSGLWGMGLVIHFIQYLMKEAQERAIEKEIERERAWRRNIPEMAEGEIKRKRDRLTLNHDGELMEIVEEDDAPVRRRR
ncbi:MAG: 2TM domain-containing protein [Chloroflexota bacterium]